MYDYRNDPLPSHTRWQTKSGRFVYLVAGKWTGAQGGSPLSLVLALLIGYIAHFFVSQRSAVVVGVAVFGCSEIILRMLLHYYGFITKKQRYSNWQKVFMMVLIVILVLGVVESAT